MAKMKFGALMTDLRNKIGGQVASKNRHGAYLRTKVTPVNRQSTAQMASRSRLSNLAKAWAGLTAAQRDAWNAAVKDYKSTDIFGDIQTPTGFNLYQKLNNNILCIGGSAIDNPPAAAALDAFNTLALTYTSGTPALSLAIGVTAGDVHGYKLFATAPQSAGKSFVKSDFRLIKVGTAAPGATLNILSDYVAKFGSVGAVGTQIFVRLVPVGSTTGTEGMAIQASTISAT